MGARFLSFPGLKPQTPRIESVAPIASGFLTDEQQPRRLAGKRFGGAVDARWDKAARPLHGDAPEVAHAEGKRPCLRDWGVVKVVGVIAQVFEKCGVVFPAKKPK